MVSATSSSIILDDNRDTPSTRRRTTDNNKELNLPKPIQANDPSVIAAAKQATGTGTGTTATATATATNTNSESSEESSSISTSQKNQGSTQNNSTSTSTGSSNDGSPSSKNHHGLLHHSVHVVASKSKAVAQTTKNSAKTVSHHAHKALKHTETVVENNKWCMPLRFLVHFPHHWPRTSAFLFGVLVPLWALIFVAMGFGVLLAQFESGTEIEGNDAILAARAQIQYFDVSATRLLGVTSLCLARWEQNVLDGDESIGGNVTSDISDILDNESIENQTFLEDFLEETNQAFANQTDTDGDGLVEINRTLLELSLEQCTQSFVPQIATFNSIQNNNSVAFESLSFNWNRCWDRSAFDRSFIFHPTHDMIVAARPENQAEYFREVWSQMQQDLYEKYLPDNATPDQEYEAFLQSVADATGEDGCDENTGGTAWFFFTIMTTVGYGNQAPVTNEGRTLVVVAGLFSLILFAAVLGLSGYVLLAIFDDFVGRFWFSTKLSNPVVGMFLWGTIWLAYALAIATDVEFWWEERLPGFAEDITRPDALWFAFISISTIGLGDYYLQPEEIFPSDNLKYSVLFMIGFVFLSTFFGKIAECLGYLMPQKHNSLEARLAATRVFACWPMGWVPWERKPEPFDEVVLTELKVDDQALLYRIGQLKELKPDPPTVSEDEEAMEFDAGTVTAYTGNPIRSMNLELLNQEEALLREWLAVVQHQQKRALQKESRLQGLYGGSESMPNLSTDPEMLATIPEQDPGTPVRNNEQPNKAATTTTRTTTPEKSGSATSSSSSNSAASAEAQDPNRTSHNNYNSNNHNNNGGVLRTSTSAVPVPPPVPDVDEEEDDQTVVTSAEETFNPLASFFNSA